MSVEIVTTGYEGESISQFLEKLSVAKIELLIDVRKLPLSRKAGFSKRSLEEALREHDIDYVHLPDLGMPDDLRRRRHRIRGNDEILDAYARLLPQHIERVDEIVGWMSRARGCLLCYERDDSQCHRSRLGQFIQERHPKVTVVPLPSLKQVQAEMLEGNKYLRLSTETVA